MSWVSWKLKDSRDTLFQWVMGVEGTTKVIGVAGTTLLVVVAGGNDLTILLPAVTTVIPIRYIIAAANMIPIS